MLYIINKSHADSQALNNCLQRASRGDGILLIEHAVYSALNVKQSPLHVLLDNEVTVHALTPDMQARGLQQSACFSFVEYVDYAGFVGLIEDSSAVRSCF